MKINSYFLMPLIFILTGCCRVHYIGADLPVSHILHRGNELHVQNMMNIENLIDTPYRYSHNDYGGRNMNNQESMNKIRENGVDVFTAGVTRKINELFI